MAESIFKSDAEDLNGFITQSECTCLNESTSHTVANLFMGDERLTLQSDADEQLLISIPFGQTVKIKSIALRAPDDDSAPTTVKIFINQPSMDFADAEDNIKPTQVLELTQDDLKEDGMTDLNYVKFQYVDHITIFVEENNGGETSSLSGLHLFGKTIHNFDMNNLKKVG